MPAKKKATAKKPTAAKKRTTMTKPATQSASMAKPGDLIVIDSPKVGSPPREGEVLEIVQGQVSVSYRVRWPDGHQSLIAPGGGITRIVSQRKT
jgi:Domain of unknown function (DUF1918)